MNLVYTRIKGLARILQYRLAVRKEQPMSTTYDEREILPRTLPSSRHPRRTVKCDITPADENAGLDLSAVMHDIYGGCFLPDDKIVVHFKGTAGDGFGCGLRSGITFVADKIGIDGCSNMTGGRAILLEKPGHGLCRGLAGGTVYVFNDGKDLPLASGAFSVKVLPEEEEQSIKTLVCEHAQMTDSINARSILSNWENKKSHCMRISAAI